MAALQTKGPARAHAGEGCSKGTEGVSSRPGGFEFFAVVEICSGEMLVEICLPECLFPQEQINMAQQPQPISSGFRVWGLGQAVQVHSLW